jgi:hypothetical protein
MPRSKSANPQTPVSNASLTALELQVAGEFVSAAGTSYIDHSCNDFDLPDTPTRRALVQAAIGVFKRAGYEPEPLYAQDGVIHYHDDQLMAYLGPRWAALSERAAAAPLNPPLCREELETMASVLDMLARNESKEYATLGEAADYALPLTPEGRQFAEAVIRHVGGADARIPAAEFGCDIHTIQCLKYLAARCQALAGVSPGEGLDFTDLTAASPRHSGVSTLPVTEEAIPELKRRGVGPGWLKSWQKNVSERKKILQHKYGALDVHKLKIYANEGKVTNVGHNDQVLGWTIGLPVQFIAYASARTCLAEDEALRTNSFPRTQWGSLFAAIYLHSFSEFCGLLGLGMRFSDDETRSGAWYPIAYYAAMGVVMGFREHAIRVARLQVLGHRLELFSSSKYYPAAQTLLRIFADYFGEPEIALIGEALTHPIYNALAKHWRHPEALV